VEGRGGTQTRDPSAPPATSCIFFGLVTPPSLASAPCISRPPTPSAIVFHALPTQPTPTLLTCVLPCRNWKFGSPGLVFIKYRPLPPLWPRSTYRPAGEWVGTAARGASPTCCVNADGAGALNP